jgi:nicotinate-nucleotide adenylyltransferase
VIGENNGSLGVEMAVKNSNADKSQSAAVKEIGTAVVVDPVAVLPAGQPLAPVASKIIQPATTSPARPIGILGGTFDPIHLGHLHLARTVIQQARLQKIKLIPCYQSPHRHAPLAASEHRVAMIKLALAGERDLELDELEVKQSHISYTVDTLEKLRQDLGAAVPLCLVMGADAFAQFHLWRKWQRILQLAHLIVVTRGEYQFKAPPPIWVNATLIFDPVMLSQKSGGYIWFTDIKPLDISATGIRGIVNGGGDIAALVPPAVRKYIAKHHLYTFHKE